jgi:outer membrane protein
VKKPTLHAAAFLILAGLAAAPQASLAQTQPRSPANPAAPHKIGLIDMAQVFKSYKKFEAMREELKGELQKSEDQFKRMTDVIRKEQSELKNYKQGTEEYANIERTLTDHTTKAAAFQKTQQRDLVRREAAIYKTIYLEVADAVQKCAASQNYTLVLRFSRDEVDSSDTPEDVMRGLNRQVVYYRPNDDITNAIIGYLNRNYEQAARGGESPAAPVRR